MAVTIMQGDSYAIFMNLTQNGFVLTPDMINDLEVCVGANLRLSYSDDSVWFDDSTQRWYIWPTQEQTFGLEPGIHKVEIRVKYRNQNTTNVKGYVIIDKIKVNSAVSREVL